MYMSRHMSKHLVAGCTTLHVLDMSMHTSDTHACAQMYVQLYTHMYTHVYTPEHVMASGLEVRLGMALIDV